MRFDTRASYCRVTEPRRSRKAAKTTKVTRVTKATKPTTIERPNAFVFFVAMIFVIFVAMFFVIFVATIFVFPQFVTDSLYCD